jgi:NTE family protein
LEKIALTAQWDELLRSAPRYQDRSIAEKQEWFRTELSLTLRLQRNLSLPNGLNSGQLLALMLSRYTAGYSDLKSFDDLPTPFRCVSTDLTNSAAFTLDSGSLPLAMRATMAIPGMFTPVKWGDRLLVDGGVVDNIPVDVVRKMKTDTVIAVSLDTAKATSESLSTLTGVLKQVVSVVINENEQRSLKAADLVIAVQLQKFNSTDYDQAGKIMAAGYSAAEAMGEKLRPLELNDAQWREYQEQRKMRTRRTPERGRVVAVASPVPVIQKDATEEVKRKLPGEVDQNQLESTMTGMASATTLPAIFYGWGKNEQGAEGYKVSLEERPNGGEVLLRPSLSMQASGGEPTRVSLHVSGVGVRAGDYKARLLSEVSVGYDPGLRMEYYHPFDGHPYFVAPGFVLQRSDYQSYNGIENADAVRDRYAGTLYAGLGTWRFIQWRVGTTAGYDRVNKPITVDGIRATSEGFANMETSLLVDKQDSTVQATHGERFSATLGYSVREHSFPYLKTNYRRTLPLPWQGLTGFVVLTGNTSFGRKLDYYDQYTAGGFASLDAYRVQEFHANTMGIAGGGVFMPMPIVKLGSWKPLVAVWHEGGRFDLGSVGWQTHQSSSIGLFGSSPLAPVGVVLSVTEDGKLRLRFVFGRF